SDVLTPPILRLATKNKDGTSIVTNGPFITVQGSGYTEINGHTIEYFQQQTQAPVLKTEQDGVLRLNNVTLSADKRTKDKNTGRITTSPGSTKTTPFIEAQGKLILLYDVLVEPSNFNGCSGISLIGTKGASKHRLFAERSKFQVLNNNRGDPSFLNSKGFASVFKSCV
ncbi:MAG: hypothetical protein EZS28_056650, partial [Streblomastix strix]